MVKKNPSRTSTGWFFLRLLRQLVRKQRLQCMWSWSTTVSVHCSCNCECWLVPWNHCGHVLHGKILSWPGGDHGHDDFWLLVVSMAAVVLASKSVGSLVSSFATSGQPHAVLKITTNGGRQYMTERLISFCLSLQEQLIKPWSKSCSEKLVICFASFYNMPLIATPCSMSDVNQQINLQQGKRCY